MSDDPASIEAWQEQEKSDIVARLRVINHHTKKLAENEGLHYVHREAFTRCEDLTWEAANEIERLNACIERLRAERDALFVLTDLLTAEHDALRAERDEVRQSYCSLMEAYRGGDGRVTANKLGWGYLFEEDKPCHRRTKSRPNHNTTQKETRHVQ